MERNKRNKHNRRQNTCHLDGQEANIDEPDFPTEDKHDHDKASNTIKPTEPTKHNICDIQRKRLYFGWNLHGKIWRQSVQHRQTLQLGYRRRNPEMEQHFRPIEVADWSETEDLQEKIIIYDFWQLAGKLAIK